MVALFFYAACVRDGISEVQQSDVKACERSIYFQGVRVFRLSLCFLLVKCTLGYILGYSSLIFNI